MAHASYVREKARSMRVERQLTIDQLAERLALSRSTIYGRPLGGAIGACASSLGRLPGERSPEGQEGFDELATDPTFRDFVCMYIAEGYKRNRNCVSLANSDPAVMRLAVHWFRRLGDRPPGFAVQYHADQDLNELREFWGKTVDVDAGTIKLLRKSNSNQLAGRTWRSRYGVLTVRVHDTLFRARLQAWMDRLRSEWR